jgi:hypothetical protein
MAAPSIAPQVEFPVEEKIVRTYEPTPIVPKPPVRNLLSEIFEGHEEFLGWAPD